MADLSITAANVIAGAGATIVDMTALATIAAGEVVFRDDETERAGRADSNAASADTRTPYGIALNGASAGQPIRVLRSGPITIGATLTAGTAYFLSGNVGALCPAADLSSGMYPSFIGIATSTSVLLVNSTPSGVAL